MTVPFPVLRDIDTSRAGFDDLKNYAIQNLGAGKNGKHHIQFTSRLWNGNGPWGIGNGNSYSDTGYQASWTRLADRVARAASWSATRAAASPRRSRCATPTATWTRPESGPTRRTSSRSSSPSSRASVLSGTARAGCVAHLNPFWKLSYSYYRVGQYQTFGLYERERQGNVFFAGEHCSMDYQGFMEGAAFSGTAAGNAIVADLRAAAGADPRHGALH